MTKVFKALSDGTRQQILRLLERRECTVGEIVSNFELSQPTISRHLSVLKEANLVVDKRRGQNVIYRLNHDALADSMRGLLRPVPQLQASSPLIPRRPHRAVGATSRVIFARRDPSDRWYSPMAV